MGNKSSHHHGGAGGEEAGGSGRPHKGKLYGLKKRLSFRKHHSKAATAGTEDGAGPSEAVITPSTVQPVERNPQRAAFLSADEKSKKEKTERRGSVTDAGVNRELWQKIMDGSIIGTKKVQKALIYRLSSGSIIVSNPPEFRPSVRQLVALTEGLQDPTQIAKTGIDLLADSFQYKSGVPGSHVEGVDESGEMVVLAQAGHQYALVGIGIWTSREDMKKLFAELCEYLMNQSEF